jgi:hypothetical protein
LLKALSNPAADTTQFPLLLHILCACSDSQSNRDSSGESTTQADLFEGCMDNLLEMLLYFGDRLVEFTEISGIACLPELLGLLKVTVSLIERAAARHQQQVHNASRRRQSRSSVEDAEGPSDHKLTAFLMESRKRVVNLCEKLLQTRWAAASKHDSDDSAVCVLATKNMLAVTAGLIIPPTIRYSCSISAREIELLVDCKLFLSSDVDISASSAASSQLLLKRSHPATLKAVEHMFTDAIDAFVKLRSNDDDEEQSTAYPTLSPQTFISFYNATFQHLLKFEQLLFDQFAANVARTKKEITFVHEEFDLETVAKSFDNMVCLHASVIFAV